MTDKTRGSDPQDPEGGCSAEEFAALLAEERTRAVVELLTDSPRKTEQITEATRAAETEIEQTLGRLEEAGLVERRTAYSNPPQEVCALTPRGERLVAAASD